MPEVPKGPRSLSTTLREGLGTEVTSVGSRLGRCYPKVTNTPSIESTLDKYPRLTPYYTTTRAPKAYKFDIWDYPLCALTLRSLPPPFFLTRRFLISSFQHTIINSLATRLQIESVFFRLPIKDWSSLNRMCFLFSSWLTSIKFNVLIATTRLSSDRAFSNQGKYSLLSHPSRPFRTQTETIADSYLAAPLPSSVHLACPL